MENIKITLDENNIIIPNFNTCKKFYNNLLYFKNDDRLNSSKSNYELKRKFEYEFELDLQNIFQQSIEESYEIFFKQYPLYRRINKRFKILYSPSKKILPSKYKFILGVDSHLYGLNLIGKTLEKFYYGYNPVYDKNWIFIIYNCINVLISILNRGNDILEYANMSPLEILKKLNLIDEHFYKQNNIDEIYKKFIDKKLNNYNIIKYEFDYPMSLVYYVRKVYAPFINFNLDFQIRNLIFNSFINQLETKTKRKYNYSTILNEKNYNQVLELYSKNKIPMDFATKKKCNFLIKNIWSDKKVIEAISFIPNNSFITTKYFNEDESKLLILSENNEPISPLYLNNLEFNNLQFPSILHLTYYKIFIKMQMSSECAYKIICKDNNFIDFYKCDVDYQIDYFQTKRAKKEFYKLVFEPKLKDSIFIRTIIKLNNCKNFNFVIPNDSFLSSNPNFNIYKDMIQICNKNLIKNHKDVHDKFQILLSITNDFKKLNVLEKYFFHIYNSLNIIFNDLKWDKDLKHLKNALKIIYPSIYTIYKSSNLKKKTVIKMFENLNDECNNLIFNFLYSLVVHIDNNKHIKIKKSLTDNNQRCIDDIIKKVCYLFYYTPNNNNDTINMISKILRGKEFNYNCNLKYKNDILIKKVKNYKIKDENIINNICFLIEDLKLSNSFQNY